MTTRAKLPTTRHGHTHRVKVGVVTLYVTVNEGGSGKPMEVFIKASDGWQGWCDTLAITASMALQHGCPLATIMRKWRGQRFAPDGIAGQGTSIPDAVARLVLAEYCCDDAQAETSDRPDRTAL